MSRKCYIILAAVFIVLALGFYSKHEVQLICAKTGSTKGHHIYYHFIKTDTFYTEHWIEEHLRDQLEFDTIEHEWIQIVGTRQTIFGSSRKHSTAPAIYKIKDLNKEQTSEFYDIENLNKFVRDIYENHEAERHQILQKK